MKCGFIHSPDMFSEDPDDKFYSCEAEATVTCCDYGGAVCIEHKCRCSRPLTEERKKKLESLR